MRFGQPLINKVDVEGLIEAARASGSFGFLGRTGPGALQSGCTLR
jgi:hypothetical protein